MVYSCWYCTYAGQWYTLCTIVVTFFLLMCDYQCLMIILIKTILFLNLKYILPSAATTNTRFSAVHVPWSLKICIIYTKIFNFLLLLNNPPFSSTISYAVFFIWFFHFHIIIYKITKIFKFCKVITFN